MVEADIDLARTRGHIVVSPNQSAHWRTTKRFLWLVSGFALAIGLTFALSGAWLVLPFAGLEVTALVWVMYCVARQCHQQQVIYLDDKRIRVEKGYRTPKQAWDSELFWTRLIVSTPPHRGHPQKLILRGKQQQVEIGEFLNEQDKKKLIGELRCLMSVVE